MHNLNHIHSCGYHCDKPGCIKEQRDDLVKKFIVNAINPLIESNLRKAAQALVDRWDTPLWKDAPHTGVFIDALHAALAQPEPLEPAGEEDMKVYAAIAEGYGRLEKRIGCVQHDCDVCQARALAQPAEKFCDANCVWTDHHPDCALAKEPLTDQEIIEAIKHISHNEMSAFAIARAIEKVLK